MRSNFIPFAVRPPAPTPAQRTTAPPAPGLRALIEDSAGHTSRVVVNALDGCLRATPEQPDEKALPLSGVGRITLSGYLAIDRPGVYQLSVRASGRLSVTLGNRSMVDTVEMPLGPHRYALVGLEAGWHALRIELMPALDSPELELVLAGEAVPRVLAGDLLGHD